MARALSAVERREYVRAVIRITRHQGRLTTAEAMNKLGLSRATVQRYFSKAEATGEVVGDDDDPSGEGWSAAPMEYREDGTIVYQVGGIEGDVLFEEASHD